MSIFHRKPKEPKHKHDWKLVHQKLLWSTFYGKSPHAWQMVMGPDAEWVASLRRCSTCGYEIAEMNQTDGRWYVDVRDVPPGFRQGPMDPSLYRMKFMGDVQPTGQSPCAAKNMEIGNE